MCSRNHLATDRVEKSEVQRDMTNTLLYLLLSWDLLTLIKIMPGLSFKHSPIGLSTRPPKARKNFKSKKLTVTDMSLC